MSTDAHALRTIELPMPSDASLAGIEPDSLAEPVEWMRYCYVCNADVRFLADRIFAGGLIGRCTKCGDELIAPFTRTTLEVCA